MNTELYALKPFPKHFEHNGKRYLLKPFTLFIQTWIEHRYGSKDLEGVLFVAKKLEALDPSVISEITFSLLSDEDKDDFKNDIEIFVNSFSSVTEIISKLLPPLTQTLIDSQPEQVFRTGVTELKKSWARRILDRALPRFTTLSRKDTVTQ